MDNIKDVVKSVMASMAQKELSADTSIERIVNGFLSEQEKKHIKFLGYKEGKILFNVDTSAWLFQMNIRKSKMLDKLKEEKPDVKNISFKIGKVT